MYDYEKCLLSCYGVMGEIIEEMDRLFLNAAINSYKCLAPCEQIADKLIGMTDRKRELEYVKNTVEEALGGLSEKSRRYIAFRYFGEEDEEIEKIKGERSYFRRQISAMVKFSSLLNKIGFTEEEFFKYAKKFAFLSGKYNEIAGKSRISQLLPSKKYKIKSGKSFAAIVSESN